MNEIINDINALEYGKYRTWKPFMEKYNCQIIAEIGVREGYNFEKMIEHNPKVAVAIDLWKDDGVMARNDIALSQAKLDTQYNAFIDKIEHLSNVNVLREYSFDAVKRFPDEYFDLVYIDADHTYEGCYKDIVDWYPKVKKGGFLLGDDYRRHKTRTGVRFGVVEAVNKFAHDNNLSFWVFPRSKWGMVK
jgi:hypothetical protein